MTTQAARQLRGRERRSNGRSGKNETWKFEERGQTFAVIEVKFADTKQARNFRDQFVKKQKSLEEKINVTPVVRLATKVRIEMLHSIAYLYKRFDSTVTRSLCLQYVPKPVIRITRRTLGGTEATRTMTFIESICWVKENGLANALDLNKARDRAGARFRGTLAQTFVLMQ